MIGEAPPQAAEELPCLTDGLPAARSRYRGTDVAAVSAEGGQETLASLLEDRTSLVPARTSAFLARCQAFRSLDEHAAQICRSAALPPERTAAIRRRLERLAAAGFLTSYDDLLRRCQSQTAEDPSAAPIAMLGIPSCDRPDTLARALRSYMHNSRDHGRHVEFVVIDDSRSAANRAANLANLTALQREYGTSVSYASAVERHAYARALADASGVSIDTVRFGLLGAEDGAISTGACRNALLLHAAGDRFIHVDDDTVCNVAPVPNGQPGIALAAAPAAMEQSFFASGEEARAAVAFGPEDYVGLYERVLGRTVGDVLTAATPDQPIDLDLLPPAFARLLLDAPCRIAVASLGVVGDSGLGTTEMYLFTANPASRARLLGFQGGHREAFQSQQVIRAVARTTIARTGPCLGIALGLDVRALLPPFMPALRNSDGVFSDVRLACFPETSMAFLPWVVEHSPPQARRDSFDGVLRHAGRVGFPVFLTWLIRAFDASDAAGARALVALGDHLVEVGSLALPDYAAQCRDILRKRLDGMCQYMDTFDAAQRGDEPEAWRRDVAAYLAAAKDAVRSDAGIVPLDFERRSADAPAAIAAGQRLARLYGELLRAWPAIVDAARELRRQGQRPARVL